MKALVYEGPRTMTIRDAPIPEPAADEVLIRVAHAGICGSELGGYLGHNSLRKPPLIMGHEFSGTVERAGRDVSRLRAGDRVTANPLVTCGKCFACTTGSAQLCAERKLLGAHLPGAFAEYVVAPERNVFPLEAHVSMEEGAYTEPFACAVHICSLLRPHPGDRLLIVGAGPIGLLALQALRIFGVEDVTVVDLNEERLEIARELGARTSTRTGDAGAFDAAVDAVGAQATRTACALAVRPGGSVVFTGLHEAESRLPINDMIRSEIRTCGAFAYSPADFTDAQRWIAQGKVQLAPWTSIVPLKEGGASFDKLIGNPGKTAKILLVPGG
ncbi:galactitol-1-phosphate 5-dehydrogenase [Paenibacillus humicola]|uniref:galactitol-1-phosphate 5-dehydrogenase n=1 Tax=Paenibacillus humicola TaxID=3110540 RepID=UPI00237B939A|nr:galactitol-1-phosphate 5-dehydrogenase [Paenibacillus humicola]